MVIVTWFRKDSGGEQSQSTRCNIPTFAWSDCGKIIITENSRWSTRRWWTMLMKRVLWFTKKNDTPVNHQPLNVMQPPRTIEIVSQTGAHVCTGTRVFQCSRATANRVDNTPSCLLTCSSTLKKEGVRSSNLYQPTLCAITEDSKPYRVQMYAEIIQLKRLWSWSGRHVKLTTYLR
jgi:hypothetical protein